MKTITGLFLSTVFVFLSPQISKPLFALTADASSFPGLAVQDLDEGFAEFNVESGVDDRVDGAVEVAQPGDGAVQRGRDATAPAVGLQDVGQEERQPADYEHTLERKKEVTGIKGRQRGPRVMQGLINFPSYPPHLSSYTHASRNC